MSRGKKYLGNTSVDKLAKIYELGLTSYDIRSVIVSLGDITFWLKDCTTRQYRINQKALKILEYFGIKETELHNLIYKTIWEYKKQ